MNERGLWGGGTFACQRGAAKAKRKV